MNVTMEVSVPDIIRGLSGNNQDPVFLKALQRALEKEKTSTADFVDLFAQSFKEVDANAKLASIFNTVELKDRINYNSTNADVIKVIRDEANAAIDRTFNILRTRIDRFGVTQPNIQKLQTAGRILIELPGIRTRNVYVNFCRERPSLSSGKPFSIPTFTTISPRQIKGLHLSWLLAGIPLSTLTAPG